MEFKTKFSGNFIINMLLIVLATGMALFTFVISASAYGFLHYGYLIWASIAVFRLLKYYRWIYFAAINKTILAVNEEYIYDLVGNIKYYWKDIDEVFVENSYLHINLYQPEQYLDQLSLWVRYTAEDNIIPNRKTLYTIDLDMVNVNLDAFLHALDNYSQQWVGSEK